MWLFNTAVKSRHLVVPIVLSLLLCVFDFDKIKTSSDLKEST